MLECRPYCCWGQLFCYLSDFLPSFLLTYFISPSHSVLWTYKSLYCLLVRSNHTWYALFSAPAFFVTLLILSWKLYPACACSFSLRFVLFSLHFNLFSLSFALCCIVAFLSKQTSRPDLIVLWMLPTPALAVPATPYGISRNCVPQKRTFFLRHGRVFLP